jgi:hypothetical protein
MSNMYKFTFDETIFTDVSQVDCHKFNETCGDCFISGTSSHVLDLELVFMYHRLYRGGRVHRSCVNEGSGSREEESDHNVVSALAGKASRLVEANARHVESKATSVEAQTPRPSLWTR